MLRLIFGTAIVLVIFLMSPERRFHGGLPGSAGRALDTSGMTRLVDRTVSDAIQTTASATLPRWLAQSAEAARRLKPEAIRRRDGVGEPLSGRDEPGAHLR